jgi:hypothetical protein
MSGGNKFGEYFECSKAVAVLGKKKRKKTPWSESASKLYRPSDRRLSAK